MWFVLRGPQKGDRDGGMWHLLWSLPFNTEESAIAYLKTHGGTNGPDYVIAYAEKEFTLGVHFVNKEEK